MARQRKVKPPVGKYILGKTIGEGTFGKVKLGTHVLTGEKVAVKILERERIKEVADVERVAREIHILKMIQHPNIIKLYEIIETPQQLLMIMEYCSGGELFDHIVERGRVPEKDACRFFQQIVSGVEQVHKINVVHRDLKPENLLLDEHKHIKIVDFGLSNIFKDGQLLKTACGSPCYAAPEMIAGHEYVPQRCDVWSCGVILFALVCGYLPFEDQNTSLLYRKILNADYQTPKFISEEVRDLIQSMLTIDPLKRITIEGIRRHSWYKIVQSDPTRLPEGSGEEQDKDEQDNGEFLEEDILTEIAGIGFDRGYTAKCLSDNRHNSATAAYYLLVEKKRREAEQWMAQLQALDQDAVSCSDSSSSSGAPQTPKLPRPPPAASAAAPDPVAAGRGRKHRNGGAGGRRNRPAASSPQTHADWYADASWWNSSRDKRMAWETTNAEWYAEESWWAPGWSYAESDGYSKRHQWWGQGYVGGATIGTAWEDWTWQKPRGRQSRPPRAF